MGRRAAFMTLSLLAAACISAPPESTPLAATPAPSAVTATPASSIASAAPTAAPVGSARPGIHEGGSSWQSTAVSFAARVGERFRYTCPPDGVNWFVYGTDLYTSDSSVCTAAVHFGLITLASGGEVVIEVRPGQASYAASTRNDITSQSYGAWPASFTFVGELVTPPTAAPGTTAPGTTAPTATAPATASPAVTAQPTATTAPAPTGTSSDEYLTSDALLICLPFDRSRFAEYDSTGKAVGVDVEIGEYIAAHLGRRAELIETLFDDLIPAVLGRTCDLTIGGQFITQTRLEQIDMIPYRQGNPHVVVAEGNPLGIDDLIDLCGRRFAVVGGTVFADMVRGMGDYLGQGLDGRCSDGGAPAIDLREYDSQADAEAALAEGDVDAYAGNDFVTIDQPDVFDLSVELPLVRNGIGHLRGATTVDADVRAALRALIDDGTYADILTRYGVPHVALTIRP